MTFFRSLSWRSLIQPLQKGHVYRITIPNRSQRIARYICHFWLFLQLLGLSTSFFFLMPTVFKPKKHTHQNPRMPSPRPQELQHPHISSITDLMEEQNVSKTNSLQKEPLENMANLPRRKLSGHLAG